MIEIRNTEDSSPYTGFKNSLIRKSHTLPQRNYFHHLPIVLSFRTTLGRKMAELVDGYKDPVSGDLDDNDEGLEIADEELSTSDFTPADLWHRLLLHPKEDTFGHLHIQRLSS
ncbi:hypothetical protein RvY_01762 [Ramazzottius varieornatus]|uniref:Uncharacterized protein n=1 Tax=Ramazzottius varieornatus TaxID=947166 RepID=A0A1D1US55_RAMVA|nr:hypothetical protein RvY_01762 [Ramazzottius varieornatus]